MVLDKEGRANWSLPCPPLASEAVPHLSSSQVLESRRKHHRGFFCRGKVVKAGGRGAVGCSIYWPSPSSVWKQAQRTQGGRPWLSPGEERQEVTPTPRWSALTPCPGRPRQTHCSLLWGRMTGCVPFPQVPPSPLTPHSPSTRLWAVAAFQYLHHRCTLKCWPF